MATRVLHLLPDWVSAASIVGEDPERLRQLHQQQFNAELGDNRWPHFVNIALGSWLLTQPLLIAVQEPLLRWSEMALGILLMVFATAALSRSFPVSDATLGGYTYLLEILTGLVGAKARWRTMPWLVVLFGLMIAPLGITSIFFVIIQPIVIGTLSTMALIGAAAILIQIPYSLDELIATLQFVRRRVQAGRNGLAVFFCGDTDTIPVGSGRRERGVDEFDQPPGAVVRNMLGGGGVNLPWNLGLTALIGLALLFTQLWPGVQGNLACGERGQLCFLEYPWRNIQSLYARKTKNGTRTVKQTASTAKPAKPRIAMCKNRHFEDGSGCDI